MCIGSTGLLTLASRVDVQGTWSCSGQEADTADLEEEGRNHTKVSPGIYIPQASQSGSSGVTTEPPCASIPAACGHTMLDFCHFTWEQIRQREQETSCEGKVNSGWSAAQWVRCLAWTHKDSVPVSSTHIKHESRAPSSPLQATEFRVKQLVDQPSSLANLSLQNGKVQAK